MAVPEQTPYIEHIANGVTTSFALEFECKDKEHLIVLVDNVEPNVGTWSLVNGAVVFGIAPADGKIISIQRNTPFRRDTNFQSYDNSLRPATINKDFDWIWYKLQELGVADWILGNRIDALKNYVDDRDDELRAYLMEEIRKQGVALDQLEDYYNYLMERLAQIAVDKGWDSSFVVHKGQTQFEINSSTIYTTPNTDTLRRSIPFSNRINTQSFYANQNIGGASYLWDSESLDIDDDMFTFAVSGVAVGRWKLLIENNALNASKVGIKGGLISSSVAADYTDHIKMQALIDYFSSMGGGTIYVNGGRTYQWNVQHKSKVKIIGLGSDGLKPTIRCRDVSNTHLFAMAQPECYLDNFNLNGYDSREILQTGGSGNIGAFSGVACQSTGLIVKNVTATRCRMDGVYMNNGANNVHVYNLDSRFHARNAVSITNAWNVHFYNPIVEQRAAIQPFAYNFDIEPDTGSTQTVYDVHIHYPVMLGEGQLLLKEENTPNGRMDVHIYYPTMDIPIRLNSVVHGLYIYGGIFTKGLFVAETSRPGAAVEGFIDGAVISGSPFVQTTVTLGGDFVLRNNVINELSSLSPSRTQGTWESNTFGVGVTPVSNVDRRTLSMLPSSKTGYELVNPAGGLAAYNTTEVRQVNLTTTATDILTANNRSTSVITIAAADSSVGGSLGFVELIITSDDTASTTFATEKINGAAGINYSWSGRKLSLSTKSATANQWIVKVETFSNSANYKQVNWNIS